MYSIRSTRCIKLWCISIVVNAVVIDYAAVVSGNTFRTFPIKSFTLKIIKNVLIKRYAAITLHLAMIREYDTIAEYISQNVGLYFIL